jgi:hypothetical protein
VKRHKVLSDRSETYVSVFIKTLFRVFLLTIKEFVMEKQTVFTRIFSLILAFGLLAVLTGCPTGNGPGGEDQMTKFEGTWKHDMAELNAVYTFKGNSWTFSSAGVYGVVSGPLSGTFVFDDSSITFTVTSGDTGIWTQPYTISVIDNKTQLSLELVGANELLLTNLFGVFNKE